MHRDIVLTATRGLLLFRQGLIEEGRERYLSAITEAKRRKEPRLEALARVFLAMEEIRAQTPALETAVREARLAAEESQFLDVKALATQLP